MLRRTETKTERRCETEYVVDDYLRVLGEEYFHFVLRHSDPANGLPPVMVINWNEHIDLTHPTAYTDAVRKVLERVNDYFAGRYQLPNFTVVGSEDDFKLANSAGEEMEFAHSAEEMNNEVLFKLARGEDVQLRAGIIQRS